MVEDEIMTLTVSRAARAGITSWMVARRTLRPGWLGLNMADEKCAVGCCQRGSIYPSSALGVRCRRESPVSGEWLGAMPQVLAERPWEKGRA